MQNTERQRIKVGEVYPLPVPSIEGFACRMIGQAFHIVGFDRSIKARDVREFGGNPLRYGVFRYGAGEFGIVPFLVVKIAGTDWYFDVSFNLPIEDETIQASFLSADGSAIVPIVLCDYPSGKVRVIRAITVDADTLNRIRETCRAQHDGQVVDRAISECYLHINLDEMIAQT